jgi:hypothetical protein
MAHDLSIGHVALHMLDVCLMATYYCATSFFISAWLDEVVWEDDEVSVASLALKSWLHVCFIAGAASVLQWLAFSIPFPFDGFYGYNHSEHPDIRGGIMLGFIMLLFQKKLSDNIWRLRARLFGEGPPGGAVKCQYLLGAAAYRHDPPDAGRKSGVLGAQS